MFAPSTVSQFAITQSVRSAADSQSDGGGSACHGSDERDAEPLASGKRGEEIGHPVRSTRSASDVLPGARTRSVTLRSRTLNSSRALSSPSPANLVSPFAGPVRPLRCHRNALCQECAPLQQARRLAKGKDTVQAAHLSLTLCRSLFEDSAAGGAGSKVVLASSGVTQGVTADVARASMPASV
jgi:hypothetical protein